MAQSKSRKSNKQQAQEEQQPLAPETPDAGEGEQQAAPVTREEFEQLQQQFQAQQTVLERTQQEAKELRDRNDELEGKLSRAVDNPVPGVTNRTEIDPEADVGSAGFNEDGELEVPQRTDWNSESFQKKADELHFMQEKVVIQFHQVSERGAQQVIPVAVNGEKYYFARGRQYTVPRYVVETLARAVSTDFQNVEYQDSDGAWKVRYDAHDGQRFPFHIVEDSKQGRDWFLRFENFGSRSVHV